MSEETTQVLREGLNNRTSLIEYGKRTLGEPTIEVAVTPEQYEDRVDEAIQFFQTYNSDAVAEGVYVHTIVQEDLDEQALIVPEGIFSIKSITSFGTSGSNTDGLLFDTGFHIAENAMNSLMHTGGTFGTGDVMTEYNIKMGYYQDIQKLFDGKPLFTFSRHADRIQLRTDWNKLSIGQQIAFECTRILNPEEYTDMYNDMWLKRYVVALFKRQWGQNLSLFSALELPGGMVLDGKQIYDSAMEEIRELEEQIKKSHQKPIDIFIG